MKTKKTFFAVFAVIILLIPLYIILQSEDVLENGHRHKLQLRGYDPFDPFRGKFLRLNYDNSVPSDTVLKPGDKAYILLVKEESGFSRFSEAKKNKPNHSDYLEAEVLNIYGGTARIKIDNLNKYFINENKAKIAEELLLEFRTKNPDEMYVAIRVLNGESRLEDIFIKDTPLLKYLDSE